MRETLQIPGVRSELEEVKQQMKKMSETKKEEKKRLADEDATRRIKQLEAGESNFLDIFLLIMIIIVY